MVKRILALAVGGALALVLYQLIRVRMPEKQRAPRPTDSFSDALARLKRLQATDHDGVNPRCHTRLLDHGQATERVVVLLHGYTNCPYQFLELGKQLHASGYNVLIPRYPHHGLEPLSDDLGKLTVEDLIGLANEAVDIATGLGEQVSVCGLSLGGALASWVAQNRSDVDRVVALSPALGVNIVPPGWRRLATNVLATLPNFYRWGDPAIHEPLPGREHQYPRLASHGLAAILRLGQIVFYQAQRSAPAARSILVAYNAADQVVDNDFTAQVVSAWREEGGAVETRELPADLALFHDYIDPTLPDQQVEVSYPIVTELLA